MDTLSRNKHRDNCFDFLRLFAAFCVVVQHAVFHLNIPFLWMEKGSDYWFYDGVPLFFMLSGYLVYRSYERCKESNRPVYQYFINRFLRIAPGLYTYLIIVSIALILIGFISVTTLSNKQFLAWFASTLILIPVYHPNIFANFGSGIMNGSLWTIPAEFGFYMIVPILFWFEKRLSFKWFMIALGIVAVASSSIYWMFHLNPNESMIEKAFNVTFFPYLIYFGLGIFWMRMWSRVSKHHALAMASALLYVIIRYDLLNTTKVLGPLFNPAWAIPLSYFVIWIGYHAPKFFARITAKIGDLSYGIYIWHMVVINFFIQSRITQHVPSYMLQLVLFATVLAIAACSWRFIEKQALKRKPFTSSGNRTNVTHLHLNLVAHQDDNSSTLGVERASL